MPPDRRPILVTGSHRSGSSWVGQMISLSPRVGYIHEPFALHHHRGVCAMEVPYWFLDVTPDNAAAFRPYLQETLRFRYRPDGGAASGEEAPPPRPDPDRGSPFPEVPYGARKAAAEGPVGAVLDRVAGIGVRHGGCPSRAAPRCVRRERQTTGVPSSLLPFPLPTEFDGTPQSIRGRDQGHGRSAT